MIETVLAICAGYVIGQVVCIKYLAHDHPNVLNLLITVVVIAFVQVAQNIFLGTNDILTVDDLFMISAGCSLGHIIVTCLFRRW